MALVAFHSLHLKRYIGAVESHRTWASLAFLRWQQAIVLSVSTVVIPESSEETPVRH